MALSHLWELLPGAMLEESPGQLPFEGSSYVNATHLPSMKFPFLPLGATARHWAKASDPM